MNEEVFNLQMRKFLKRVGITCQREIEKAVRAAIEDGSLSGSETLNAVVTLRLGELGAEVVIEDTIALE